MNTSNASNARISATRRNALSAAVIAGLLAASCAIAAPASPAPAIARATVLRPGDAVVGALPMTQPIHVEVALRLRDRDRLEAYADAMAAGRAAPMESAQFLAEHAPTPDQARAVAGWLTAQGFTNVRIADNRLLVSADATARTARDAFGTTFAQVRTHDGRLAYANTTDAQIPAALSDKVLAVLGLQTVHMAHTFLRKAGSGGVHTNSFVGHNPLEFSSIYGGASATTAANTKVGIITEGSLTQTKADLATFATNNSLAAVPTLTVNTNGTSTDTSGTGEWNLDSQDIVGMAGGQVKQLIFYNIPALFNSHLVADFNTVVSRNEAKIINVSLGECETGAQGDGSYAAANAIFLTAVAQGQTFSVSTGDSGADECGNNTNTPSWPANSKYVVAVAGTKLATNASTGAFISESVWTGSGGSPSTYEAIPSWQSGFGIAGTKRVVADVAFDADPNTGAQIYVNGALAQYGGTSLSAPLFAGLWARVLQTYPTIGFAAPVLYTLPTGAFHDVTSGNNSNGESGIGYTAAAGYDNASGRGSMLVGTTITDANGLGNKPPVANFTFTVGGTTANFTDTSTDPEGSTLTHAWKFGDGATSTAANPSHVYAATGTYSVSETVRDQVGTARTRTKSVVLGPVQLFGNSGFETGTASPWTINPAGMLTNNASAAHAGSWYVAMGGGSAAHTDYLSQELTIPAGNTSATLAFWINIATAETTTTGTPDKLSVRIYAGGVLAATLATYSNLDKTSGYVLKTLDLSPWVGQKVKVQFVGVNNATLPTSWSIDDATLTAQ